MKLNVSNSSAEKLAALMVEHRLDGLIHFAGQKQVAESIEKPAWFYEQNTGSVARVVLGMEQADVSKIVFSSYAAAYGAASGAIDERGPTAPLIRTVLQAGGRTIDDSYCAAWPLRAASLG